MFTPGQKILCINDRPWGTQSFFKRPHGIEAGEVYTVVNEGVIGSLLGDQKVVYLEEHKNPWIWAGMLLSDDIGYRSERFRPLNDSKLDVFRKALKEVPKEDLVDA